jgi:NAD(P)-dependent dehydrogenase (short-subunit alcohol dehydrogenase family)
MLRADPPSSCYPSNELRMVKWTAEDIPDQTGCTAIVTGANTGIGFETAAALAAKGAHVVLAVRNVDKGKAAAERITQRSPSADLTVQALDLSALRSVRSAAQELRSRYETIDLLINNAGVMETPRTITEDGFELQFGTNHLGHFALTGLLLDRILAADHSRIVTVSSLGHRFKAAIRFDDLRWERTYSRRGAYAQAKLANLMFTYELQRRLAGTGTIAVAAHPGGSKTEGTRYQSRMAAAANAVMKPLYQSAAMGALPSLFAATAPDVSGGQYFGPSGPGQLRGTPKVVKSSKKSYDLGVQRRLWSVSEELTSVMYPEPLDIANTQ